MTTAIIIPARFESSRFSGKPLAKVANKPMIEWTVKAACKSTMADRIIVATDDKRIFDLVTGLSHEMPKKSIEAYITSKEHRCGTDRIAEVVKQNPDIEFVVNLQGDEPLMPPKYIDKALESLLSSVVPKHLELTMSTLAAPITSASELNNPDIVKVVISKTGYALYFSRLPIPYNRTPAQSGSTQHHYRHLGIYAFTRESLLLFSKLQASELEKLERLEQLRALESDFKIKVEIVPKAYPKVDRAHDIKAVEDILQTTQPSSI